VRVTNISKCLDRKLVLFGFEVLDLLAIFLVLSILNLLFGQMPLKSLFVWAPTVTLACILRWGKRGKPDKYLVHWVRFQIKPGIYSAFPEVPHSKSVPRLPEVKNVHTR
jgi:hypothetical protein